MVEPVKYYFGVSLQQLLNLESALVNLDQPSFQVILYDFFNGSVRVSIVVRIISTLSEHRLFVVTRLYYQDLLGICTLYRHDNA